ncbi:hypothetical protein QEV60_00560 [Trueperella pyogenes]|uniref:hypothetical protein n=1 Tax=Trueperella pyogenes TaxID=1661 RepID=UPI003132D5E8
MKLKRCTSKAFLAAVTAGALSVATTGIATASEPTQIEPMTLQTYSVSSSALHDDGEQQLANELKVLFTRYVQLNSADVFEVNETNLIADGHTKDIAGLKRLAEGLNVLAHTDAPNMEGHFNKGMIETRGAGDFALCVLLEGLGVPAAGASPGLVAAIKEGIRAWNWGLTAKTVAKILGPSVVKALGGPVGIGVALGWAAWSCRGKL